MGVAARLMRVEEVSIRRIAKLVVEWRVWATCKRKEKGGMVGWNGSVIRIKEGRGKVVLINW